MPRIHHQIDQQLLFDTDTFNSSTNNAQRQSLGIKDMSGKPTSLEINSNQPTVGADSAKSFMLSPTYLPFMTSNARPSTTIKLA